MRMIPGRNIVTNSVVLLGSVVFVLVSLEIGLRYWLKDDYSVPSHRNWYFKNTWDERFAGLNSLGWRDHEFTVEKPSNTFRILVIGDSLTFGEGVKRIDDLYTEIIQSKLNRASGTVRYEVLNVSMRGWNAAQYLRALKDRGLAYQPDLVVLGFFLNDIEYKKSNRPKHLSILPDSVHWLLSRVSYLYWHTHNILNRQFNGKKNIEYFLSYTSPESPDWKRFSSIWSEILGGCRENGIRTLVVILPELFMLGDDHPFRDVYENVANLSRGCGASVLDLFPVVKGLNPRELWVGRTDPHPNEKAQKVFADGIYRFMKEKKLTLPDSSRKDAAASKGA